MRNCELVRKEMIEKDSEVKIAKLSWPSRKDLLKAYGSMVVYRRSVLTQRDS